jgi:hypothetical protein
MVLTLNPKPGPTQAKRKNRSEAVGWKTTTPLPPTIPGNMANLLFNRTFKKKLILHIIEQIKKFSRIARPGQRIIIDYENNPYVIIGKGAATSTEPATEFEIACGLGESDIKWCRYTSLGSKILLVAVDGDFVACGSAIYERLGCAAPEIFVKRLLIIPSNAAVAAANEAKGLAPVVRPKGKKRPLEEVCTTTGSSSATVEKKGRQYEYADIGQIVNAMRTTVGPYTPDDLKPYTIRILTHAIALAGCDFTPGVPWLNGLASIRNFKLLWPGLCKAATIDTTTETIKMNPRVVAELYIGKLWKCVQFKKQCTGLEHMSFEALHAHLSGLESISKFRRDRLVNPGELCGMVKGCNW